ncbi:MAG TPA: hypothetical protein VE990_06795 [Acidimicrobiales bacterium]|nr:hypothetical protein [Acidimicrobiales bacterium]
MAKSAFGTVRRLPSGRYNARIRVRGRQINVGSYPTRREATAAVAAAGAEANGERVIDRAAGRQHVAAFAERWWATRSGHRPSTPARERMVLDHDLLPFFGKVPLSEVTAADVQAWVARLGTRLSPSSIRRAFTILDQLLDAAVDGGLIVANPAARTRLPRVDRPEMRFLAPTELEALRSSTPVGGG